MRSIVSLLFSPSVTIFNRYRYRWCTCRSPSIPARPSCLCLSLTHLHSEDRCTKCFRFYKPHIARSRSKTKTLVLVGMDVHLLARQSLCILGTQFHLLARWCQHKAPLKHSPAARVGVYHWLWSFVLTPAFYSGDNCIFKYRLNLDWGQALSRQSGDWVWPALFCKRVGMGL